MNTALLCVLALSLPQGPSAPGPADASTAVAARTGTLRATLEREGRLLPAEATRVRLDLDSYTGSLEVRERLTHGSPVNRGDILVRFDPESEAFWEFLERKGFNHVLGSGVVDLGAEVMDRLAQSMSK